jgi:hypothetical protein
MEVAVLLVLLSIATYSAMAIFRWLLELIISFCNWFIGKSNADYDSKDSEINNKTSPITIQFIIVFVIGYILGKL